MSVSDTLRAVFIGISRAFAFARVTLTNLLARSVKTLRKCLTAVPSSWR